MNTKSLWNSFSNPVKFPALNRDITVDVAIIGGGITGVTTANLLKKRGLNVAVLEAREVGKGTTGHSTGNLYLLTDQLLSPIAEKYDLDVLKEVVGARAEAFQQISNNIQEYMLDCDYKEQTMYLYEDEETDKIGKEWKIAVDAGIPLIESSSIDFPFENSRILEMPGQATFNPLRYVQELANKTQGDNCQIYENTRVKEVEEKEEEIVINTTSGSVVAKYVVHATHTPKGVDIQYHTVLGPYREYGVAVKLESNDYPDGIYWGYYNNKKYSIRSYNRKGEQYLLCIGSPHKVGQAKDNEKHIRELLEFVEKGFRVKEITHQWGGQNYKPADLLPYIGRKKDSSNQFVATGFSTDGLIYGTLSAMIISEAISGKKHKYEALFEASRHTPLKSAKKFIKENANVAKELVTGWLKNDDKEIINIPPGEGKIIQRDGEKSAVYRDREGKVSAHSAVCPHLGCIVHWNNAEETWDCPCHGSRFDTDGDVIEGPSLEPLREINKS